jgi:SagB-type dehydrogenase family enzyme
MKKSAIFCFVAILLVAGAIPSALRCQELKGIALPKPHMEGGMPLMKALAARSTSREFGPGELPLQVLSDLLWAADGVNRPDSGKRTAPSAMNVQNIDIYVALKNGLYVYDAKANTLDPVLSEDVRGTMGTQPFVKDVPLNLVYVADYAKMARGSDADKALYSAAHAGFIGQNVYLFCASEGLATVVRGLIDREAISKVMKLRPDQRVILAQSVGYPKKS